MYTPNEPVLYLLPVNISDAPLTDALPSRNFVVMQQLRHFIVENIRTARRFLRRAFQDFPIDECEFFELNEHTDISQIPFFITPLRNGFNMGLMSEAGCPAVADPGADIVSICQQENIKVTPLVGPSSILMALMGSGFNGQGFTFHGYLPVKPDIRTKHIKELESAAIKTGYTQIFIETPYRNEVLLKQLSETLRPETKVCVAADITCPQNEYINTMTARRWRSHSPDLKKHPAIFLIHCI